MSSFEGCSLINLEYWFETFKNKNGFEVFIEILSSINFVNSDFVLKPQ